MEEERNYTVYMHLNKITSKTYIGITTKSPPEKRWRNGLGYNHNQYFTRAIKKYGWDNFEHIILFKNKTQEEAEELEILFIKILLSNNSIYGYNIDNGGNSSEKMTEETKRKLSKSHKGQKAWNKGVKGVFTGGKHPQAKKVICDSIVFDCAKDCAEYYNINAKLLYKYLIGSVSMPQELYDKGLQYINDDAKVKKRTAQNRGNSPMARKVICDGIIFDCLTDCASYYNINIITMGDWLRGKHSMPVEFFEIGLKYLDSDTKLSSQKNTKHGIKKKVICENKIFDSIQDCATHYDIKLTTMSAWLNGKNSTPQKFVDLGLKFLNSNIEIQSQKGSSLNNTKKVICNKIIFNSIAECSRFYNMKRQLLNDWLLHPHRMSQEFKDMGLSYYIEEET